MPVRRKRAEKHVKKARIEKQLERVAKEVKSLDARIRDLKKIFIVGHYRVL